MSNQAQKISRKIIQIAEHRGKDLNTPTHSPTYLIYNRDNIPKDIKETILQTSVGKDENGVGEDDFDMNWQEKYFDKLEQDIVEVKESFRQTEQHISQMINQALGEMRDRDTQRHNEMIEIRQMLAEERRWSKSIALTVIIGTAAMVVGALIAIYLK